MRWFQRVIFEGRHLPLRIAIPVAFAAFIPSSAAFACGGIFDVACNLSNGGLSSANIINQTQKAAQDAANAIAKAGQDVGIAVNELQAGLLTGPALEQAIIASRNSSISGAMPIPPAMRQQLAGYASEDSLNRVRYKIGDNGFANLAHLIEQGGFASAVTLIDVVVFRGATEAADPSIWAHELQHVDQYTGWGVHSFAVQYARNSSSVENPAYAKGNGYYVWAQANLNSAPVSNGGFSNGGFFPPPPSLQLGAFCYVTIGRFGPGPVQSVGSPCFVPSPYGVYYGQVGP